MTVCRVNHAHHRVLATGDFGPLGTGKQPLLESGVVNLSCLMKLEKGARRKTSARRGAATTISSNYDSLFVHRKNALYRRAAELSAITDCNIGIILLSPEGELSQFSTAPMKKMLRSYSKLCSMPHEIHTMESIQAKVIAAGGDGIGLRVGSPNLAPGRRGRKPKEVEPKEEDGVKQEDVTGCGVQEGQNQKDGQEKQPWDAEELEAIMSIVEGMIGSENEDRTPQKRRLEGGGNDERQQGSGEKRLHRLAKMSKSSEEDDAKIALCVESGKIADAKESERKSEGFAGTPVALGGD